MTSEIKVDTISENTSANGVTIDGLTIKDGNIIGDVALAGTTPTFTIGDAGAEDASLIFDGNAVDYYIALDDSADNLIIGSGSTVGSNSLITIDSDGDFTLDSAGDIILDANDDQIIIKDNGTAYGGFNKSSNDFNIFSSIQDGDIIFTGDDGGSGITALTLDMSNGGRANFGNDIGLNDDRGIRFGNSDDLTIFHDGSNSYIRDSGTGNLIIRGSAAIKFEDNNGSETFAIFNDDGAVELYHNNVKKLETSAAGITVTGTATVVDDISISGATPTITLTDTDDNSDCLVYQAAGNLYLETDKNQEASGSFIRLAVDDLDFVHVYNGSTVFNESSRDQDFRIESNGDANCFFIDANNNNIILGNNAGDGLGGKLQVVATDSNAVVAIHRASADTAGAGIYLSSSRGASVGDDTIVQDGDTLGSIAAFGADGTDRNSIAGSINFQVDGTPGGNDMPGRIVFKTTLDGGVTQHERMRINNAGQVLVGASSGDYRFEAYNAVNGQVAKIYNGNNPSSAAPHGLQLGFNFSPDNGTSTFLVCDDGLTGTQVNRLVIYSTGGVFNHDGDYGQISDARIKDNITDANSQWNDIKAIKVRNFEFKDDIAEYGEGEKVQIGVVAQELESVSPKLIKEVAPTAGDIRVASEFGTLWTADDAETKDGEDAVLFTADDQEVIDGERSVGDIKVGATHSKKVGDIKSLTGEQVKGVSYSVLYMKAIKALQEAQTRIETLETKVAALEG